MNQLKKHRKEVHNSFFLKEVESSNSEN